MTQNVIHHSWKMFIEKVNTDHPGEFDVESLEFAFVAGHQAMHMIMTYILSGGKNDRTPEEIARALQKLGQELEEAKEKGIIGPMQDASN